MESEKYIWRTVNDDKVRSSHAEREGKIFSWTNSPEGGPPGTEHGCRCWAENIEQNKHIDTECSQIYINWQNAILNAEYAKEERDRAYSFWVNDNVPKLDRAINDLKSAAIKAGIDIVFTVAPWGRVAKILTNLKNLKNAANFIGIIADFQHSYKNYQAALSNTKKAYKSFEFLDSKWQNDLDKSKKFASAYFECKEKNESKN